MAKEEKNQEKESTAAETDKRDYFTVVSTLPKTPDGGDRVALWEKDPAHPDGEAFVAGDKPAKVGVTGRVLQLIGDGTLKKV